jgi:L-cysteate sulfo-lyase
MTANMPRVSLGSWPTPLEPAPKLGAAIGLQPDDLWIKRDDLTGLGGGGNKVRKLEYSCAAALSNGAQILVTTGAAQSNHARLTAAAGARLGLQVHLVLAGTPDAALTGNLLLDGLLGATVHWAGNAGDVELDRQAGVIAGQLSREGVRVEVIPYGGSSVLSVRGYVDCAHELLEQAPDLDHVVTAVGSGGTMAGLVHGLGARRVLGVHTGAVDDPRAAVMALIEGLRNVDGLDPQEVDVRIRLDQVGLGYSELSAATCEAVRLAARTEGLVLDPIYTGRALAGLRSAIAKGDVQPGERTIFLHSGGLPGLFGHAQAAVLAQEAHHWASVGAV